MTATSDLAKLRAAAFEALRANNGDAKKAAPKLARPGSGGGSRHCCGSGDPLHTPPAADLSCALRRLT